MGRSTKKSKAAEPTNEEEEDAPTSNGAEKTNETKTGFEGKNFYEVCQSMGACWSPNNY